MSSIKPTQGLQTKAIHAGEFPQKQGKASAPPICMSSTFIDGDSGSDRFILPSGGPGIGEIQSTGRRWFVSVFRRA